MKEQRRRGEISAYPSSLRKDFAAYFPPILAERRIDGRISVYPVIRDVRRFKHSFEDSYTEM
ncbi:MAG: hypothetical protein GY792_19440 [Gammaproteobacteria bacterium]|nr:hypothetical protein [Gammaproteobacteria bacterium]